MVHKARYGADYGIRDAMLLMNSMQIYNFIVDADAYGNH